MAKEEEKRLSATKEAEEDAMLLARENLELAYLRKKNEETRNRIEALKSGARGYTVDSEDKQEKTKEIGGPTMALLRQAIEAFPVEYPNYQNTPPQKKNIKTWLISNFDLGDKDRTSSVFATIIKEHFGLIW